jgi:5-methylcytosine-specific restriction endonuclease McrA
MSSALDRLRGLLDTLSSGNETKREDFDRQVAEVLGAERQLFGRRPRAKKGEGGLHRILAYLKHHIGEAGEELAAIAGIGEWARRVRQLRVEHGYEITELGGSVYRLESVDPDEERAAEWQLLNSIRKSGGSARARIEKLLSAKVGGIVTRDQIDYVAGSVKEGIRRQRELRDERGWPINSYIDEPGLKPSEYRLVSADPDDRRDPRQRLYPEDLRERVFARDEYRCQQCGRTRDGALKTGDTRFYLEVHHKKAVAEELDDLPPEELNDEDNLVTLCHRDHVQETRKLHKRRRAERRAD